MWLSRAMKHDHEEIRKSIAINVELRLLGQVGDDEEDGLRTDHEFCYGCFATDPIPIDQTDLAPVLVLVLRLVATLVLRLVALPRPLGLLPLMFG